MYQVSEIKKMVFFDLETAPAHPSLEALEEHDPKLALLWRERCKYLRTRFEENRQLMDGELYLSKAALSPEFNRIVCASFARVKFEEDPILGEIPKVTVKSYCSSDEKEVLHGISEVFEKFTSFKYIGHNVKRFDVPVLCKRILINSLKLPVGLHIHNLKPWEMPFIDTSEIWSFGAWQEGFASLDLICSVLGIESPKSDLSGKEVGEVFWQQQDLDRIAKYCESDVVACIKMILKLSGLPHDEVSL